MTSVPKAGILPDNSALVATEVKNAADVTLSTNSNSDNIAEGYSSVSSNDTHVKHLADAIVAGAGIVVRETNDGGDETLTVSAFNPEILGRVDNDTLVVGAGGNDTQTLIDLATAGNWIGGASLESADELVHVYEVLATPGTYKLSDKHPQYTSLVTANRIADMQVNQAGWDGTAALGLDATSVIYDNGTDGDQVAVGNYVLIYDDASFTLGRGRDSGGGAAVGNLSVARITGVAGGAVSGTLTLEAGHQIAINDDDYMIIVDAGQLLYRFDGSAWYRHVGAWWNDGSSNLLDLTAQYGIHRKFDADSYITNEGADYTTASGTFVDVDATNLELELITNGGDVLIGFTGNVKNASAAASTHFDLELDGVLIAGDDGIHIVFAASATAIIPFTISWLQMGLTPGKHVIKLQWKTSGGSTATMLAGAGTGGGDVHPQFWAKEI